jgi:hypothetical protein
MSATADVDRILALVNNLIEGGIDVGTAAQRRALASLMNAQEHLEDASAALQEDAR